MITCTKITNEVCKKLADFFTPRMLIYLCKYRTLVDYLLFILWMVDVIMEEEKDAASYLLLQLDQEYQE